MRWLKAAVKLAAQTPNEMIPGAVQQLPSFTFAQNAVWPWSEAGTTPHANKNTANLFISGLLYTEPDPGEAPDFNTYQDAFFNSLHESFHFSGGTVPPHGFHGPDPAKPIVAGNITVGEITSSTLSTGKITADQISSVALTKAGQGQKITWDGQGAHVGDIVATKHGSIGVKTDDGIVWAGNADAVANLASMVQKHEYALESLLSETAEKNPVPDVGFVVKGQKKPNLTFDQHAEAMMKWVHLSQDIGIYFGGIKAEHHSDGIPTAEVTLLFPPDKDKFGLLGKFVSAVEGLKEYA